MIPYEYKAYKLMVLRHSNPSTSLPGQVGSPDFLGKTKVKTDTWTLEKHSWKKKIPPH